MLTPSQEELYISLVFKYYVDQHKLKLHDSSVRHTHLLAAVTTRDYCIKYTGHCRNRTTTRSSYRNIQDAQGLLAFDAPRKQAEITKDDGITYVRKKKLLCFNSRLFQ